MRALATISTIAMTFTLSAYGQQAASFCPDLFALASAVKTCKFNPLFVKAAEACFSKLNQLALADKTKLAANLSQSNEASSSAQLDKLGNHSANLTNTTDSLKLLRQQAVQARNQMLEYRENFMHAGNMNKKLVAMMSSSYREWLDSFSCYSESHASITKYIGMMEEKITELNATLGDVSNLSDKTNASIRKISSDNGSATKAATNVHGQGSALPTGKASNGSSSISGVETDAAKRAKTVAP